MSAPKPLGIFDTKAAAIAAGFNPRDFRTAGIHEVMGPHFKPILYVANRPYVRKENEERLIVAVREQRAPISEEVLGRFFYVISVPALKYDPFTKRTSIDIRSSVLVSWSTSLLDAVNAAKCKNLISEAEYLESKEKA